MSGQRGAELADTLQARRREHDIGSLPQLLDGILDRNGYAGDLEESDVILAIADGHDVAGFLAKLG